MVAEETDTEVPISEVAPRPDPGRQYVGRAGGVLQVCDDGGGGVCRHLRATREAAAVPTVWPTVRPMAGCQRLAKGGLRAEGIGLGREPSR